MSEDLLTASFFILSWLTLTLGLTQLVAMMALRAAVGDPVQRRRGEHLPPRSEAGTSFSHHYSGRPFLHSFLEAPLAVQLALNTLPSKSPHIALMSLQLP